MIQVYQCVLRNIVENCTDEDLICVLLEKDLYRVPKMYKSTLSNTILKMWDIARVIYKDYIPTHRVFYITQKNDKKR